MQFPNGAQSLAELIAMVPKSARWVVGIIALILLALLSGYNPDLPDQVEDNTESIDQIQQLMRIQDARWERVLCHLQEQRKENPSWSRCEGL